MIKEDLPLVSVIIPTCKRSDMLSRAVESVLNQTWNNIEVIIVNDNIPDSDFDKETKEVLLKYQGDDKVRLICTSGHIGGGAARNFAIKYCSGDYVTFLDDDDRFLPDKIEKQLLYMQDKDLDMCYQDVEWHNENEKLVEYRKMDYVDDFSKEGLIRNHILHSICPTSIYMIKRNELLKTDGFGEVIMGQDWFLMLRCIEAGLRIGYMPGAYVVQYLHNGERISLGDNKIKGENFLYEYKKKYYYLLSKRDVKYVKFRHYAVLAFTCLRSKKLFRAIKYALETFFTSPYYCIIEFKRYFNNN